MCSFTAAFSASVPAIRSESHRIRLTGAPAQRRIFSLVFLVLAAGLLCLLIARLEPRATPVGAVLLAAIWFLHPVQADNVLLLSGRTAMVSAVFLLAALLAMDRSRPWLAAVLFVLACLSRETALAGLLPLAVVAASRPGVSVRSATRQVAPVLGGAALVLLWILTTPRYLYLAEFSFLGRPFWLSFVGQVGAVPVGLELLVRPAQLTIDYGIPLPTKAGDPLFLLGLGLYFAAAATAVLLLRRSRVAAIKGLSFRPCGHHPSLSRWRILSIGRGVRFAARICSGAEKVWGRDQASVTSEADSY